MTTKTKPTNLTLRFGYDQDVPNPAEDDLQWRVVSFISSHVNYESVENYQPIPLGLRRKLEVGTAFFLDYYEHSLGVWSISGEGPQCQWDNSRSAGLIIFDHKPSEMGAKTVADRAKDARGFLEQYNDWCNGQGYYCSLEDEDGDVIFSSQCYASDLDDMFEELREYTDGANIKIEGDGKDFVQAYQVGGTIVKEFEKPTHLVKWTNNEGSSFSVKTDWDTAEEMYSRMKNQVQTISYERIRPEGA